MITAVLACQVFFYIHLIHACSQFSIEFGLLIYFCFFSHVNLVIPCLIRIHVEKIKLDTQQRVINLTKGREVAIQSTRCTCVQNKSMRCTCVQDKYEKRKTTQGDHSCRRILSKLTPSLQPALIKTVHGVDCNLKLYHIIQKTYLHIVHLENTIKSCQSITSCCFHHLSV